MAPPPRQPVPIQVINALRDKAEAVFGRKYPKAPPLQDKRSQDPTIRVSDLAVPPKPPTQNERETCDHVMKKYRNAKARRQQDEFAWELRRHHVAGRQWFEIGKKGVVDPRNEEQMRYSITINLIKPILEKVVAMATEAEPDVVFQPLMPTEIHRMAAEEAKSVHGHCAREEDDAYKRQEQATHALTSAAAYRYLRWDPNKTVLVPLILNGEAQGAFEAAVGDIDDEVLPADCVLIDPAAAELDCATWIIVDRVKPLDWVQMTYGLNADGSTNNKVFEIKPDALSYGYNRPVPGVVNGYNIMPRDERGNPMNLDAVHVLEYYQKPNPKTPEGRYVIVAGMVVLWDGPWPYDIKDEYPLAEMKFSEDWGNPYGNSLVAHLMPMQHVINRQASLMVKWADKTGKLVVLRQELDGAGHDPYKQREALTSLWREQDNYVEIMHRPGTQPPTPTTMPQINNLHVELWDRMYHTMQEISGAVDVLRGETPPGVTAGVTVNLLQQSAASLFKPFIRSISKCAKRVAKWRIAHYSQFVKEPRLLGSDVTGTPNQTPEARYGLQSLQALTAGGKVAVELNEGSALVLSKEAKRAELIQEYMEGRLGPPGSPQAMRLYWEHVDSPLSLDVLAMLDQQDQIAAANAAAQQQAEQDALGLQQDALSGASAQADQQANIQAKQAEDQHRNQMEQKQSDHRANLNSRLIDHALKQKEAHTQFQHQMMLEKMKSRMAANKKPVRSAKTAAKTSAKSSAKGKR